MEEWSDIKGYEGLYQVSSLGKVKSLNYNHTGEERILKLRNSRGYCHVNLYKEGKMKHFTVHRLVANAFIPNPNNYPCINHKDECKTNNNVNNLEWCTHKYNNLYGTRLQRTVKANKGKKRSEEAKQKISESHKGKKQSEECIKKRVEQIQKMVIGINKKTGEKLIFQSIKQASEELNINDGNISSCCLGKRLSAGGYTWSYY